MPLTPADVHNVAFKKPPIGKRGYDEDEVDAFLDEVERELARLIEDNNELRAAGGSRAAAPVRRSVRRRRPASRPGERRPQGAARPMQRDKAAAEQAARSMQAELEQIRCQGGRLRHRRRRAAGAARADDGSAHR